MCFHREVRGKAGDMVIEGEINAVIYGDSQVKGPLGFVGRLLK